MTICAEAKTTSTAEPLAADGQQCRYFNLRLSEYGAQVSQPAAVGSLTGKNRRSDAAKMDEVGVCLMLHTVKCVGQ